MNVNLSWKKKEWHAILVFLPYFNNLEILQFGFKLSSVNRVISRDSCEWRQRSIMQQSSYMSHGAHVWWHRQPCCPCWSDRCSRCSSQSEKEQSSVISLFHQSSHLEATAHVSNDVFNRHRCVVKEDLTGCKMQSVTTGTGANRLTVWSSDSQFIFWFAVGYATKRTLNNKRCDFFLLFALKEPQYWWMTDWLCNTLTVISSVTSAFAKTVKISAVPPFVIQIFSPFNKNVLPSSDNVAFVWIEAASLPLW